ncbi:glycosyltransferase [Prevotella melaninogenica]|uniref:glycosyltransferase n=1 Tax=Prevotella melaninogenica TaxID=28132 RepID=UPI001C5FE591|nr:glycosyltransferase [Prevotella melaninogenica]MBW4899970.1 glycosyltransferase [Prevotella melaninogenica]
MDDYKYKLSIIIPMYNAEKYIGICLDSILGSNLLKEEYEIVIVNDGSQDKSPEIAQNYAAKYSNVTYLTQENQGQSTARNYGIKTCKGEYVWCVDADDAVEKDIVGILHLLKENPSIDILGVQLKDVDEDYTFICNSCTQPSLPHNKIILGRDAILLGYKPSSVCALITSKKFIIDNELFFVVGITHQDVELSYRLVSHASKVLFSDIAPYIYIQHPLSVRHTPNPKKRLKYLKDDIVILDSFKTLSEEYNGKDNELADYIAEHRKNVLLGNILAIYRGKKGLKKLGIYSAILEEYRKCNYYPIQFTYTSLKKRILSMLLNNSFMMK